MNTIYIDFAVIGDETDFYDQIKSKIELPEYFGNNIDALEDVISGNVKLPLHLEFVNMTVDQLEDFEDILSSLEELDEELESFTFTYFLEQYEDNEE